MSQSKEGDINKRVRIRDISFYKNRNCTVFTKMLNVAYHNELTSSMLAYAQTSRALTKKPLVIDNKIKNYNNLYMRGPMLDCSLNVLNATWY